MGFPATPIINYPQQLLPLDGVIAEQDPLESLGTYRHRFKNLALEGNNPSRIVLSRPTDEDCRLEIDAEEAQANTSQVIIRLGRNTNASTFRFVIYKGSTIVHELHSAAPGDAQYSPNTLCRAGQTLVVGASAATNGTTSVASLELGGTNKGLLLNRLTTTQRDAVSGWADGTIIYNSTTNKFQGRAAGAWVDLH